jgi:pilus assembly protein CpaF
MTDIVLFIQSDDGETRAQRLRVDGALSIGRHYQNTVCLDSDLVSRHHARVELLDDGLRVEDASSNGTMAGEVLLRGEGLDVPYGTPLKVGNYTLQIDPAPVDAPAPLPARAVARPTRPPSPTMPPPVGQLASPLPVVLPPRTPSRMPPALASAGQAVTLSLVGMTSPRPDSALPLPFEQEDVDPLVTVRREALRALPDELGIATSQGSRLASRRDPSTRGRAEVALRRILEILGRQIAPDVDRDALAAELADEAFGLGPLERLMADPDVFTVMVTDPCTIYADTRAGRVRVAARFTDEERVRVVIDRLLARAGKAGTARGDAPAVIDARLEDGTRVNVVSAAVARRGACLTLYKARPRPTLDALVEAGGLSAGAAAFLRECVVGKRGVLVAGGAGCGKTTLLNALCGAIPDDERIVTIEDSAELDLSQPHVVSLETARGDAAGDAGARALAQELLRNARRMRADRIVVGECRGAETLELMEAMGSGQGGALTTTYAQSPREALARLESLMRSNGAELAPRALRERIAASIQVVVLAARSPEGGCVVSGIDEVIGVGEGGAFDLRAFSGDGVAASS